jgi:hypothetical protein
MSRGGKKLTKTEKRARRLHKDAQALDALVKDTAAVFRSSSETVEDCATECDRRRDDLEADLKYRRLAYHIWRWRPGAEELASAMAELIAENERHLAAMEQLGHRFDGLTESKTCHELLGSDVVTDEHVRRSLFPELPS